MRIAIIPARGGSKRIPRKNLKMFCGRPIIEWSIEVATASGCFDRVLISTEDTEIADVALRSGAEVPFMRPVELADDLATTAQVMAHATSWVLNQGWKLSTVCCLYATAPLVAVADLRLAVEALEFGPWAYTFAATPFASPIFRAFRPLPEGGVEMFFPEHLSTRSQDLPTALHDAGQFYCGRPSSWVDGAPIFGNHSMPIIIPRWRVQDIDDENDWKRAEMIFQQLRAGLS